MQGRPLTTAMAIEAVTAAKATKRSSLAARRVIPDKDAGHSRLGGGSRTENEVGRQTGIAQRFERRQGVDGQCFPIGEQIGFEA